MSIASKSKPSQQERKIRQIPPPLKTSGVFDAVIVGGFGHAGLPLALSLANKGKKICSYDIDQKAADLISRGEMPFLEEGGEQILQKVSRSGHLKLSLDPSVISQTEVVIIIIGTPVDKHLNPLFEAIQSVMESIFSYLRDGQVIILRSTVYPGTTERLQHWLKENGKQVEMAFCPERIAEGHAIKELEELPQIISSFSEHGLKRSRELFNCLTRDIILLEPIEAELAKLFTNVWRYLKFSVANQFFMIANDQGADFFSIYKAMVSKYERAKDLPKPGFAAGPCLFKDTMQLAAFNNNNFNLGHAAMLINEGLPSYVVNRLKLKYKLRKLTVGILGMAFKANSDDSRESLSYKLRKILNFEARKVLCSDVYISAKGFVTQEELIKQSDIVILAAPHREYANLKIPDGKVAVDIWDLWGNGCII